jgi:hypothetical protein
VLIAVDKLSVTLYENSSQPDPGTQEALLQEKQAVKERAG